MSTQKVTLVDADGNIAPDRTIEILKGNITGVSMLSIIGHDEALSTTRLTVSPAEVSVNIDQSVIHSTPSVVNISSSSTDDVMTSGTGLWTVLLQGLSAAGAEQTEVVELNGQNGVATLKTWSAINGMRGQSAGSGTKNAGDVYCGTGTITAGVPAVHLFAAKTAFNNGMTAVYTVPTGMELFLRLLTVTLSSANKDLDFYVETSADGVFWITENVFGMEPGAVFQGEILSIPSIPAGSMVRIEALSSAAGTDITVVLGCELHAT